MLLAGKGIENQCCKSKKSQPTLASQMIGAAADLYLITDAHSSRLTELHQALHAPPPGSGGLSVREAARRLKAHGPNELPQPKGKPLWSALLGEVHEPQQKLLLVVAVLYTLFGEIEEGAMALGVIALMVLAEVVTEWRAKRAVAALSSSAPQYVAVVRHGDTVSVLKQEIVPGDVILLRAGFTVPADARLVSSSDLEVSESALTGESVPVSKGATPHGLPLTTPLGDRSNIVHSGSLVTKGTATAIVVCTGQRTEIGRVHAATDAAAAGRAAKEKKTPLQKLLRSVAGRLTYIALAASLLGGLLGLVRNMPWQDILLISLSLAFATIPEELPILIAAVLAVGARALAKTGIYVKRLRAMESLAYVDVILTDKTGTLTQNKLSLSHMLVPAEGRLLPAPHSVTSSSQAAVHGKDDPRHQKQGHSQSLSSSHATNAPVPLLSGIHVQGSSVKKSRSAGGLTATEQTIPASAGAEDANHSDNNGVNKSPSSGSLPAAAAAADSAPTALTFLVTERVIKSASNVSMSALAAAAEASASSSPLSSSHASHHNLEALAQVASHLSLASLGQRHPSPSSGTAGGDSLQQHSLSTAGATPPRHPLRLNGASSGSKMPTAAATTGGDNSTDAGGHHSAAPSSLLSPTSPGGNLFTFIIASNAHAHQQPQSGMRPSASMGDFSLEHRRGSSDSHFSAAGIGTGIRLGQPGHLTSAAALSSSWQPTSLSPSASVPSLAHAGSQSQSQHNVPAAATAPLPALLAGWALMSAPLGKPGLQSMSSGASRLHLSKAGSDSSQPPAAADVTVASAAAGSEHKPTAAAVRSARGKIRRMISDIDGGAGLGPSLIDSESASASTADGAADGSSVSPPKPASSTKTRSRKDGANVVFVDPFEAATLAAVPSLLHDIAVAAAEKKAASHGHLGNFSSSHHHIASPNGNHTALSLPHQQHGSLPPRGQHHSNAASSPFAAHLPAERILTSAAITLPTLTSLGLALLADHPFEQSSKTASRVIEIAAFSGLHSSSSADLSSHGAEASAASGGRVVTSSALLRRYVTSLVQQVSHATFPSASAGQPSPSREGALSSIHRTRTPLRLAPSSSPVFSPMDHEHEEYTTTSGAET